MGPAWQRLRELDHGINLYDSDGSHPSPAGSYLLACVLVKSLFGGQPHDLPASASGHAINDAGQIDSTRKLPLVSLAEQEARTLQNVAASVVDDLRRTGGTLHAPNPEPPRVESAGNNTVSPQDLAGEWAGELTYYPGPALLNVTLRFNGNLCEGQVAIHIPARKQRYEAPVVDCVLSEGRLGFAVVTLPAPFLFDRFEGTLTGSRLTGKVERRGRELTNSMSGVWSLGRKPGIP